jgi:acetoin utilization deacetylase AcuC-like enzyme
MSIHILYHNIFYLHEPPPGSYHPENPHRLTIAVNTIKNIYESQKIVVDTKIYYDLNKIHYILKAHEKNYVDFINGLCNTGYTYIDSDTYVSKNTCKVAEMALIASMKSVDIALSRNETLAFALVRPPGHHAGRYGRAMGAPTQGFCIFNNIATAAFYGIDRGYIPFIIMDIDVHHGNGTQEIFWYDPRVIHIDIHQLGIYPGTGFIDYIGGGEAKGTKVNIPLPPYSKDDDYLYIVKEIFIPVIETIKPKAIAVSAGFDAFKDDGLSEMELTQKFYRCYGSVLRIMSKRMGIGIAAVLEGGYSIGLKEGISSFILGFLDNVNDYEEPLKNLTPSKKTIEIVANVRNNLKSFLSIY